MIIPGYLDGCEPPVDPSTLLDATSWLDDPACWPALLYAVGGARHAVEAFDVDHADLDAMLDKLGRPDQWPVFTLTVGDGNRIHLVWRNFVDDAGWDYVLALPHADTAIRLAALEGHFTGPAWPWPELVDLADQPDPQHSSGQRLLLLLPAVGDHDIPARATDIVVTALTEIGARRHQAAVARELLTASGRFWGSVAWGQLDGVPICHGAHSLRGASHLDQLHTITQALST